MDIDSCEHIADTVDPHNRPHINILLSFQVL